MSLKSLKEKISQFENGIKLRKRQIEEIQSTINFFEKRIIELTVSGKKELQVEIRDKKALIEAMIKDNLLEMIEIKEAKLKQWLKLTGKESYPGCGIQEIIAASFRGKRSA